MTVPCLAIAYFDYPTIKASIDCLLQHSLVISVIENKSDGTDSLIKPYLSGLVSNGRIKDYYLFEKNIANSAFSTIVEHKLSAYESRMNSDRLFMDKLFFQHEYVLFTDADLTVEGDFVSEQIKILKNCPEALCCSVKLDTSNLPTSTFPEAVSWVPPIISETEHYYEQYGGHHLVMMRSKDIWQYNAYRKSQNWTWTDGSLRHFAYRHGYKWVTTKDAVARHLTWDLYADKSHPYTAHRLLHGNSIWDKAQQCAYEHYAVYGMTKHGI